MVRRRWIAAIAGIGAIALLANRSSQLVSGELWPATNGSTGRSLPFGPKQLPLSLFGRQPFTGAYVNTGSAQKIAKLLTLARAGRLHLILKLAESRTLFQNPDGSFSLERWKTDIDRLRSIDLAPYVANGTVIGAELFNEPHNRRKWGGKIVTKEQLQAAAAYAKSIWPYLPVGAGRSDYLLKYAPWEHLDFGHSQYHTRKGDIGIWLRTTVEESKAAGVALLLSLNFYAGGAGDRPMTPQEIQRFGSVLAADTYACALTGYVYDDAYFAEPGILEAFAAVGAVAATHSAPPCYIGAVKQ